MGAASENWAAQSPAVATIMKALLLILILFYYLSGAAKHLPKRSINHEIRGIVNARKILHRTSLANTRSNL